jgi:nucleotide-binding universal stress UspA family protein
MNARSVLVPIDIGACPLEIFPFINEFGNETGASITLLHVSTLNVICPENRLYIEVAQETQRTLEKLHSIYIAPCLQIQISASMGNPASEIVARADELQAEMIVLSRRAGRRRRRFFETDVVEKVVRAAPCAVRVLRVNSSVDFTIPFWKEEEIAPDFEVARPSWSVANRYSQFSGRF